MIGANIKQFRKERGLTLDELGKLAGITASYLSQVERDLAEPSLASLRKIAKAVNIPVYKLLVEEDDDDKFIIRKDARKRANRLDSKAVCEFFTPIAKENANLAMVGLTCKMPPYNETGAVDDSVHNAEEIILVLKGVLEITVEEEVFILNTGDSIYIKPNLRHIMKNIGDGELEVISCISPAIY